MATMMIMMMTRMIRMAMMIIHGLLKLECDQVIKILITISDVVSYLFSNLHNLKIICMIVK